MKMSGSEGSLKAIGHKDAAVYTPLRQDFISNNNVVLRLDVCKVNGKISKVWTLACICLTCIVDAQ